jgi:integrase
MPRKRKLPEGIRTRNGGYYADFYANGRRVRKRLSSQLDVAEELLHELQARADRADFGILDNDYSLSELREQWLRHCRQARKQSTVESYIDNLNNILPRLSANRVLQITVNRVLLYRQERLDAGVSPRTVNMDVGALATMLRWAVLHGMIGTNPVAGIKPLPNDNAKEGRALSHDEVARLLKASKPHWRDVWYAFLVTGLRKEELASLTFRDIDWSARELIVRGGVAKNHRERRIPIDAGLWDILKRLDQGRSDRQPGKGRTPKLTAQTQARFSRDHVFVSTQNTPLTHRSGADSAFMRSCKLAGIQTETYNAEGKLVEHVDLHSLRRTFATSLIANGADPKSVQELLGHRTLDMTMRIYAKIHTHTKRQALGKLPYGQGTLAPEGVLEYPGSVAKPVQNGHQSVTSSGRAVVGLT